MGKMKTVAIMEYIPWMERITPISFVPRLYPDTNLNGNAQFSRCSSGFALKKVGNIESKVIVWLISRVSLRSAPKKANMKRCSTY
jgi:hypothetical protein